MKKTLTLAAVLLLAVPVIASAQGFSDLDSGMQAISSGFGRGESRAVVSGMAAGDKVMLQFPGLIDESGFFGRDQAALLLDKLFQKAKPAGFQQSSARKNSAEGQYIITGTWTIQPSGSPEARELYVTLHQNSNGSWSLVSVRSAGK
ncbi:MAG: hypothetical protein WBX15_02150 [Thermoanaerobaculia bacterium]